MFTSARIKLTVWYLLIIMSISVLFSVAIFYILSSELNREYNRFYLRTQEIRALVPDSVRPPLPDAEILDTAKDNLKMNLFYINLLILAVSATAGYFLAGRTLKPIREMLDEQNRFVADASHELRTPLTALRTEIEVNLRDKKLNLGKAKEVLQDNLEEVVGLQTLSDNLLLLARSQRARTELKLEKVSLNTVITEAVERVDAVATQKDINIKTNISDFIFEADAEKITRLLVILLDNAIKYSSIGKNIEVKGGVSNQRVKILVKDFGIGISEDDLSHIFDRFYRVDKSRSKTDGYGLGLSIAKTIIDLHHGEIDVRSKVGKGTSFTIFLPLSQNKRII